MPAAATTAITEAAATVRAAEDTLLLATAELDRARSELIAACTADGWRPVFRDGARCVMERDGGTLELQEVVARAQRAAA